MSQAVVFLGSLALYSALCLATLLVGLGVLALFRLRLPGYGRLLVAPMAGFVFWTLALGLAGGLLLPVKVSTPWIWVVSVLLMGVGLWALFADCRRWWQGRLRQTGANPDDTTLDRARDDVSPRITIGVAIILLALCAILPVIAMPRQFWFGLGDYIGSLMSDGWSYIAIGQYMWEYPRGVEGGLAPLHQYGSLFEDSRYITFSLLGFFSPLVRAGDTQAVGALLQAWTLFCTACAVASFWIAGRHRIWVSILGISVTIAAPWMANVVWANNFDQGLSLLYMPAIAAICLLLDPLLPRWWIFFGGVVAGALYTYPELVIAILGGSGVIVLARFWRERALWRAWVRGLVIAAGTALLLAAPFLATGLRYLASQFSQGIASSARPGEGMFGGLGEDRFLPSAYWGLGGEFRMTAFLAERNLLGITLTILACVGLALLLWRRQWGIVAAIVLFSGAACYFIFRQRYSYGAYKFVSLSWWMLVVALVYSLQWFEAAIRNAIARQSSVILAGLVVVSPMSQINNWSIPANNYHHASSTYQSLAAHDFRRVQDVQGIVGDQAVFVLVSEWYANIWAVYYLRDHAIRVGAYRMYMNQTFSLPTMRRAREVPPDTLHYILTDAAFTAPSPSWENVWQSGPYILWHTSESAWVTIADITLPSGANATEGQGRFLWLTNDAVNVRMFSARAEEVLLSGVFTAGPSLPGDAPRRVSVTTDQGYAQIVTVASGTQAIRVPVIVGETVVTLRVLDPPSVATLPNGDRRALLLGVTDLRASFDRGQQPQAIAQPVPAPSQFTLDVTFPVGPAGAFEPLVTTGIAEAGDFVGVQYRGDGTAAFGFVHWGANPVTSTPVAIAPGRTYRVTIQMFREANTLSVTLDDSEVLRVMTTFHPTTVGQVTVGENRIGGIGAPAARFSGSIVPVSER